MITLKGELYNSYQNLAKENLNTVFRLEVSTKM